MKKNALNLIVIFLAITAIVSSCKNKDTYPPSLSLELEPYIIYYEDTKYIIYDELGNKASYITDDLEQILTTKGDIQSYIDLNSESKLKYTVDDNGEFWSAEYLNSTYNFPKYKVSGYGEDEPSVVVTFDETIGVKTNTGFDLGLATSMDNPYFTFTYTATDDGEKTVKKVNLRVYNSYSNLAGLYISRLSKIGANGNSLWVDYNTIEGVEAFGYGFGDAKVVKFTVDGSIDMKMKVNRLVNNNKLKGTIKGEESTLPSVCVIGSKKEDKTVVELEVSGKVVEEDFYINSLPAAIQDETKTLIVISNRTEGTGNSTGRIKLITVKDSDGLDIDVPLICIEYTVKRYKEKANQESTVYDYEYNGKIWEILDSPSNNWTNTFRETFVKQVYWTAENKEVINTESNHNVSGS